MIDTIQVLKDSIQVLKLTKTTSPANNFEYVNYIVIIFGLISAFITIYMFFQWRKSKSLQDYVLKKAKISFDKEDAEQKLHQTKEELISVQNRISDLQKQIQKDLPIEARRVVLKDRLEESLENLKKFYDDVISIKSKLKAIGESNNISEELLKNIQNEIEPRFLLKEKISNNKTYLTIISTLSGIVFAVIPYPFKNYIGITLLIMGLPFVIQLINLSLLKESKDKQSTKLKFTFWISLIGTIITMCISIFFWIIYFQEKSYYRHNSELYLISIFFSILTLVLVFLSLRFFVRYRRTLVKDKITLPKP